MARKSTSKKSVSRKSPARKAARQSPRRKTKKRRIPYDTLFGLFLVLLVSHRFVNISWVDDFQNDEGVHALASLTIMDGKKVYDDFRFVQPPLLPYIGAVYMSVVGVSLVHLRFTAILASALIPAFLYFIIRDALGRTRMVYVASFLATLPLAALNIMTAYSKIFYIEPFVTFVSCAAVYAATKKTQNAFFLSGFLSAAALLLKFWAIPVAPAIIAFILWNGREKLRYFLLGFFVVMVPSFIYLAVSKNALDDLLFQAGRGGWTAAMKTKPLWGFYKAIPYISLASLPFLCLRKNRMVFLWTLSTFLFFYTIMPDAISHHTYFMLPVMSASAAVFAAGFNTKKIWFWLTAALILYSVADYGNIKDIRSKMGQKGDTLTSVAEYINANTKEDDAILSDYAMIPFIARRRQAGDLIDISSATILYDIVTADELISLSEKEKPVFVVVESRFKDKKLAAFMSYVNETYEFGLIPGITSKTFEVYRRKSG